MIPDPRPGLRVRVVDRHSRKFGLAGTVVRWSPPNFEVFNTIIYVKLDLDKEVWILPWHEHQLEPLP